MYEKMSQETLDEDLVGAFDFFDEDSDGYITPEEFNLSSKSWDV